MIWEVKDVLLLRNWILLLYWIKVFVLLRLNRVVFSIAVFRNGRNFPRVHLP